MNNNNKILFIIGGILIASIIGIKVYINFYKNDSNKDSDSNLEIKNSIPLDYYKIKTTKKIKIPEPVQPVQIVNPVPNPYIEDNTQDDYIIDDFEPFFKQDVEEPKIDKTELRRQEILSILANDSFNNESVVISISDYEDIENYETPIIKKDDPYLYQKDFGKKTSKNKATKRVDLTRTITADKMISIILITAVNSHLKGKILAMIENDVYASHGNNILIPKGSKTIGWYKPLKTLGKERLAIVWTRILTPQGVNISLKANSADVMGRSGAIGDLDNRYLQRYGLALSISTASGGISYIALKNSENSNGNTDNETLAKNQVIKDYKTDITTMSKEILKEQMLIKPTINIDSGTRLFLFPISDIWFAQAENNNINVVLANSKK